MHVPKSRVRCDQSINGRKPVGIFRRPDYLFCLDTKDSPLSSKGLKSMDLSSVGGASQVDVNGILCYSFNGTTQYLLGQTTPIFSASTIKRMHIYVEFMHTETTSREQTIVSQRSSSATTVGFRSYLTTSYVLRAGVGNGSNEMTISDQDGDQVGPINRWVKGIFSINSTDGLLTQSCSSSLFVNARGVRQSQGYYFTYISPAASGIKFLIGAHDGASIAGFFKGYIRTIAIWLEKDVNNTTMLKASSHRGLNYDFRLGQRRIFGPAAEVTTYYLSSENPLFLGFCKWKAKTWFNRDDVVVVDNATYQPLYFKCVYSGLTGTVVLSPPNTRPAIIKDGSAFWRLVSGARATPLLSMKLPFYFRDRVIFARVTAPKWNPLLLAANEVWGKLSVGAKNNYDWTIQKDLVTVIGGWDFPEPFYVSCATFNSEPMVNLRWGNYFIEGMHLLKGGVFSYTAYMWLYLRIHEAQAVFSNCGFLDNSIEIIKGYATFRDCIGTVQANPDLNGDTNDIEPSDWQYSGPGMFRMVQSSLNVRGGSFKSHAVMLWGYGTNFVGFDAVAYSSRSSFCSLLECTDSDILIRGDSQPLHLLTDVSQTQYMHYNVDTRVVRDTLLNANIDEYNASQINLSIYRTASRARWGDKRFSINGNRTENPDVRFASLYHARLRYKISKPGSVVLRLHFTTNAVGYHLDDISMHVEYFTQGNELKVARQYEANPLVECNTLIPTETGAWVGALNVQYVLSVTLSNAKVGIVMIHVGSNAGVYWDPDIEEL